ncbi:NrfD/PsrC family molybdoenzyme membrane anchor subunit [Aquisphaera insulae]|uniref:NrfD/PsrC family molybdoenzyme membrane anchor subunit n=1 Tax=Aquisphaera insulae TaxID=2712864 RepID=UPI0013EA86FE|nr:NrfD/PsrC family molybdoenzyme membrane anchor subunit [Aquisphaera insulae]
MRDEDRPRAIVPGYADRDVTKVPGWHGLVVWDVLLNSLTTGLYLFAAVADLGFPGVLGPAARAAYPVALAWLMADLLLLVLDLGDPLRFHHMLRIFKPSSPMSLGTWSLTAYSMPLGLIVGIELVEWLELLPAWSTLLEGARTASVVLALLPAFGSVAYKGVLFSTSSQPGWKDARWLGGFMANSAALLGCVQILVLATLRGEERAAAAFRGVAVVLLPVSLIPTALVFREIRGTLARLYTRRQIDLVTALIVAGGTLAPWLILLLADGAASTLIAASLVLLGSLAARARFLEIPHASQERRGQTPAGASGHYSPTTGPAS